MSQNLHPHQVMLNQFRHEFAQIFAQSVQGVYAYLDDPHWIGNERLAAMLGYASAAELHALTDRSSFLEACVVPASQQHVVETYQQTVGRLIGSHTSVTMLKKGGGAARFDIIFVPVSFQGTRLALHFLSPAN